MSYTLRQYQVESVDAGSEFLRSPDDRNGISILPCGAGKSLVIAGIANRLGAPVLVFQPSKELVEQNKEKMESFGIKPAVFSASLSKKEIGSITLATIGSVNNCPELFRHFKFVIADECHAISSRGGMYSEFFNSLNGTKILGLTATPFRLHSDRFGSILKFLTRTRPRVFEKVIHVVQNEDLFREGYLSKLDYKEVKTGFRSDRLRLNSTGADYTDESMREHFRELNFSDQIVRCVMRLEEVGRGSSLVFTRFVEEAQYAAKRAPASAIVTAETPKKEREEIIREFKAGRIRHLFNVGVLVLGFDYPALANVVLARPTRSLALYYQMTGRVMRPHPSKQISFVIDMVGLAQKFGRVEDLRIVDGGNEKWHVESKGRKLTNVYFDKPPDTLIDFRNHTHRNQMAIA